MDYRIKRNKTGLWLLSKAPFVATAGIFMGVSGNCAPIVAIDDISRPRAGKMGYSLFPHERNLAVRAGLTPAGDSPCFWKLFLAIRADTGFGRHAPPLHPHPCLSVWHLIPSPES